MNTHAFGNHSVTCPVCQRTGNLKLVKICHGLFTCPSCQERLVVTWSGHYVRDPFKAKQLMLAQLLRRQSKPWARIIRDFGSMPRPALTFAFLSAVLFGISLITIETLTPEQNLLQKLLEPTEAELLEPQNEEAEQKHNSDLGAESKEKGKDLQE